MKTIEQKRSEAAKRQAEYDKLSFEEKLARLGGDQDVNVRERAKLLKTQARKLKDPVAEIEVDEIVKERKKAKERRHVDRSRSHMINSGKV